MSEFEAMKKRVRNSALREEKTVSAFVLEKTGVIK